MVREQHVADLVLHTCVRERAVPCRAGRHLEVAGKHAVFPFERQDVGVEVVAGGQEGGDGGGFGGVGGARFVVDYKGVDGGGGGEGEEMGEVCEGHGVDAAGDGEACGG